MGLDFKYVDGQTPLSEEEKQGLLIKSITTREELDELEQLNIEKAVELRMLLDDTKYWIENDTYPPDEIAIRFKHRLINIHCFPNGNGRHSRLMADILIESVFGKDVFTWNNSNLVKPDNARKEYIDSIRKADNGLIEPLLEFARK